MMQEELPFVELFLASDDTSKEGQRVRKFVRQVLRKLNVRLPSCVVRIFKCVFVRREPEGRQEPQGRDHLD